MVSLGRPGKTTKSSGQSSSKPAYDSSPRSSMSPIPPSRPQEELESAAFPPFEQNDVPSGRRSVSSPPSSITFSTGHSSSKHSWGSRKSPVLTRRSPKDMTIPEFYSPPPGAERNRQKSKVHIIPHRKKGSNHDATSLDLSVSSVDNEGLGIYTSYDRDRRNNHSNVASRTVSSTTHNGSTNGGTQYSATAAPTQYVHPMRQVPRPYTPPVGAPNQNSAVGSDQVDEIDAVKTDGRPPTPSGRDWHTNRSSSVGTEPRRSFNFHFANDSISLFPTTSHTNVAGTGSTHSRTVDSMSYLETIPRSSLEFPFRSKSRTSTSTDPVARAAAVQAARQAFEDREAAKARKLEKAQDKGLYRRERKEQDQQQHPQQEPQQPRQRCAYLVDFSFRDPRGNNNNNNNHGEKNSRSEDSGRRSRDRSRDLYRDQTYGSSSGGEKNEGYKIRNAKSAWLLFLTWLRTRIFKMGKKIKKKSG